MTDTSKATGQVTTSREGHALKIMIGNVAKKNGFSPEMM